MYKPIEKDERESINKILKVLSAFKYCLIRYFQDCNAEWLIDRKNPAGPQPSDMRNTKCIVSINNALSSLCLDDENITKSMNMSSLKKLMAKSVAENMTNLTRNVLDQKETDLCVPISVATLIKHAVKTDLGFEDIKNEFTIWKILVVLTMVIYPRSLSGLNLNPVEKEKGFQVTDIELLLGRLSKETVMHSSGWDILRSLCKTTNKAPWLHAVIRVQASHLN